MPRRPGRADDGRSGVRFRTPARLWGGDAGLRPGLSALPRRSPSRPRGSDELSPAEGLRLVRRLAAFGYPARPPGSHRRRSPQAARPLRAHRRCARGPGLGVSVAPSVTPLLTPAVIMRLREAAVEAISLSLDGADPPRPDAPRGVPGCFERTLRVAQAARVAGSPSRATPWSRDRPWTTCPGSTSSRQNSCRAVEPILPRDGGAGHRAQSELAGGVRAPPRHPGPPTVRPGSPVARMIRSYEPGARARAS